MNAKEKLKEELKDVGREAAKETVKAARRPFIDWLKRLFLRRARKNRH